MFDQLKLQFYCKCKKVNRILFLCRKKCRYLFKTFIILLHYENKNFIFDPTLYQIKNSNSLLTFTLPLTIVRGLLEH